MARVALVTLPDEGAAEMVRGALNEVGIEPEFERVFLEHPFRSSALAEPWRVYVPADRLREAQAAVARLVHDMTAEVEAQSMAWSWRPDDDPDDHDEDDHDGADRDPPPDRSWRSSPSAMGWALALTILLPLLTIGLTLRKARLPHRTSPTIEARELRLPSSLLLN